MTPNAQQQVRAQGFAIVECAIPDGMTISDYRASRPSSPPRRRRLLAARRRRHG